MSPRELRLRERIDDLLDEREQLADELAVAHERLRSRRGLAQRHCVYCGRGVVSGRAIAVCSAHLGLEQLDPFYSSEAA